MLGSRALRTLLVAAAASNLGDGVTVAAAPLLAASLTTDPRTIGAVGVALTLPWLLFALPSGAVADRADRRWLMVGADLVRAGTIGLLAVAVLAGRASIPVLLVVFCVTTSADTVFHNASQAALPMVVERDGLPRANARFQTVQIAGTTLVGPPLGGVLFAVAAAAPFAVDAASFLISGALLSTLRGRLRPERTGDRSTIWADITEGARWLLAHRVLRTICWVLTLENIVEVAGFVMLVLLAREELGLDARGYGLLLASFAVGGLGGLRSPNGSTSGSGTPAAWSAPPPGWPAPGRCWPPPPAPSSPAWPWRCTALRRCGGTWSPPRSVRRWSPSGFRAGSTAPIGWRAGGRPRWARPPVAWSRPRSACARSMPAPLRWWRCWR